MPSADACSGHSVAFVASNLSMTSMPDCQSPMMQAADARPSLDPVPARRRSCGPAGLRRISAQPRTASCACACACHWVSQHSPGYVVCPSLTLTVVVKLLPNHLKRIRLRPLQHELKKHPSSATSRCLSCSALSTGLKFRQPPRQAEGGADHGAHGVRSVCAGAGPACRHPRGGAIRTAWLQRPAAGAFGHHRA